eukprot:TRINITY_DN42397_c0_g1_i3.p3 TRINITY_DN42397_c0_g1~~TRINITY_DN42397_c0_g1_i3.p3  ORF type:complete len:253 (+),score=28.46 TRINITY_DN42397_c0_g1_i3:138-896(+)
MCIRDSLCAMNEVPYRGAERRPRSSAGKYDPLCIIPKGQTNCRVPPDIGGDEQFAILKENAEELEKNFEPLIDSKTLVPSLAPSATEGGLAESPNFLSSSLKNEEPPYAQKMNKTQIPCYASFEKNSARGSKGDFFLCVLRNLNFSEKTRNETQRVYVLKRSKKSVVFTLELITLCKEEIRPKLKASGKGSPTILSAAKNWKNYEQKKSRGKPKKFAPTVLFIQLFTREESHATWRQQMKSVKQKEQQLMSR